MMDLRRFRVQLQPRKHGKKLQTSYKGYRRVEKMHLQTLRGEFESLQMRKAESIFYYFSIALAVSNLLKRNCENIKDVKIMEKILCSLSLRFKHIVVTTEVIKDLKAVIIKQLQGSL